MDNLSNDIKSRTSKLQTADTNIQHERIKLQLCLNSATCGLRLGILRAIYIGIYS